MTPKRLAPLAVLLAVTLTGCAGDTGDSATEAPGAAASGSAGQGEESRLLAEHGLAGMDTVEVVDHLDRLGGDERPDDLMASVRPDEVVVASAEQETSLPVPEDQFYLSVAPFVDQTHECFYHSLTTCQGELTGEEVDVEVVDAEGNVLVDEARTTFDNGFVGLWLPRDIEGTLRITHDGRTGEIDFATDAEAPTCLTTLQLA